MTLHPEVSSQKRSAPGGSLGRIRSWVGGSVATAVTVIVVLSGLLLVAFTIGRLLPIDPVLRVIGDHAPQVLYDQTFRELHLDRPLLEQFILFCRDMLQGDFGVSTTTGKLVADDMARFFPATLELATVSIIIGVGCGLPLGMMSARYAGRWPDQLTRAVSLFGHSVPIFWLGLVGLLVFYARLNWVGGPGRLDIAYQYKITDRTGMVLVDTTLAGDWHAFANAVSHIALPGLLLGLVAVGDIARTTRGFLLWQLQQDYINVARLKGLSEAAILWRHAVPNALGPILAVIAFTYAALLEGAVLTETVFAWPGLGLYITQSLFAADMRAVLASTLIIGAMFLLLNMLAELAQSRLDPRARVR